EVTTTVLGHITTMNPDGTDIRKLGRVYYSDVISGCFIYYHDYVWSPDGTSIAYRVDGSDPGLYVVSGDGSTDPRHLTNGAAMTWSPDGTEVVVSSYSNEGCSLRRVDIASGDAIAMDLEPKHLTAPQWSPDGEWIAALAHSPEENR